ncbi:hypothetical protein J5N97_003984 [Dioscorea zingiberensis]|uniref:Protein kinase domain-containing protein n=1 Tax=Dioscorea zingiberensis TaxID=325984 RepID=A0A9D5D7L1_9LILI|nr:hypothetical protein J5N97_003984 [Dioscorea zingiberensis]
MAVCPRFLLILFVALSRASAEPTEDRAALLDFISKTLHSNRIQWDPAASACDWTGVTCDPKRSSVVALRLPAAGLLGSVPNGTLARLSSLRVLSLHSNRLSGPLPSDLSSLSSLRHLYLQDNRFSGGFPPWIPALTHLTRLDLSENVFDGEVPFAVNNLTRLTGLFLQRNRFSGELPSIAIQKLVSFNVSDNQLNGPIPESLARFPASSFAGNLALCGGPLPPCTNPIFPSPTPAPSSGAPKSSSKLSMAAIIGISVAAGAVVLVLLLAVILWCAIRRKRGKRVERPKPAASLPSGEGETGGTVTSWSSKDTGSGIGERANKRLTFVEGTGYSFDLEDLLRASAEVLGKGSMGTSYKAVLEEGTIVVVKRLKDVAASRKEFEAHAQVLGRLPEHENVLPLRAYYYSKDEKLVIYDYLPAGSLYALLRGSRGTGRTLLDWGGRLKVAMAAARGLSHIHNSARMPHGNVKASNILLRDDPSSAAVSDFGLTPFFGSSGHPPPRFVGYRAPEFIETRRPTFKSDVFSFGVLLLELLTGRSPNQTSFGADEGADLPRWVQSVVREEWTAEVFDGELVRSHPGVEDDMVQVLQVALACVSTMPDSRPDMAEVVRMIEEILSRSEFADGLRHSSEDSSKGSPPSK